jgi:hypothetical protein
LVPQYGLDRFCFVPLCILFWLLPLQYETRIALLSHYQLIDIPS